MTRDFFNGNEAVFYNFTPFISRFYRCEDVLSQSFTTLPFLATPFLFLTS